jgi:hypothetical protein
VFLYQPYYICHIVLNTSGKTLGGMSCSWLYGCWIYNYLCNQCLSLLTLWVRIPLRRGVLDTTYCDQVFQWLSMGQWLSLVTLVSSTNKSDRPYITEILLKVALSKLWMMFILLINLAYLLLNGWVFILTRSSLDPTLSPCLVNKKT